jgi:hypothetical protein
MSRGHVRERQTRILKRMADVFLHAGMRVLRQGRPQV